MLRARRFIQVSQRMTGMRFLTITPLTMPALSPTMSTGRVLEWAKKPGDAINPGDLFCRIETDKAAAAFDNVADEGYFARYIVEAGGGPVPVGDVIALLVDDKNAIDSDAVKSWKPAASAAAAPAAAAAAAPVAAAAPAVAATTAAAAPAAGGRIFASPYARNVAKELGVSLSGVVGTGGTVGRIVAADVAAAAAAATAAKAAALAAAPVAAAAPAAQSAVLSASNGEFEDVPLTAMRRTVAQRLTQSKSTVPHYYLTYHLKTANMTSLLKHLNEKGAGKYKISVNDFLIKAIARANLLVPQVNTHFHPDFLRTYKTVDVSVAVATPTGLITPIIRDAQAKTLVTISNEMKELAKLAREGNLQPKQYQGGTVTISNMGGLGVEEFSAILNPPQAMILAVSSPMPRPEIRKGDDGEYQVTGKVEMTIACTASFDHRVVDGAVGAEWFKHFKDTVENPLSLLL